MQHAESIHIIHPELIADIRQRNFLLDIRVEYFMGHQYCTVCLRVRYEPSVGYSPKFINGSLGILGLSRYPPYDLCVPLNNRSSRGGSQHTIRSLSNLPF